MHIKVSVDIIYENLPEFDEDVIDVAMRDCLSKYRGMRRGGIKFLPRLWIQSLHKCRRGVISELCRKGVLKRSMPQCKWREGEGMAPHCLFFFSHGRWKINRNADLRYYNGL